MITPRGILFDLDDTLVDRRRSVAQYAHGFMDRFCARLVAGDIAQLTDVLIDADGNGYRERIEMMGMLRERLSWASAPSAEELQADWRQHFAAGSQPMEGLYPLFDWLVAQEIHIGVVTNGGARTQNRKIDALGIRPHCTAIVVSDAVGIRKPDPAIYHLALSQLSLPPDAVWFVGDHPINDVIVPSGCGMRGIWREGNIPWPADHPLPDNRIRILADMMPLIEKGV